MTKLELLQARIAARTEALRAERTKPVKNKRSAGALLRRLPPESPYEGKATKHRRAELRRELERGESGIYSKPIYVPRTFERAQRELERLGPFVLGERGYNTRYRAALNRAYPELVPSTKSPDSPKGFNAEPQSLPPTFEAIRAELESLGSYTLGESSRKARRRAFLQSAIEPIECKDEQANSLEASELSLEQCLFEIEQLGPYILGERRHVTQRRAEVRKRIVALGAAVLILD